MIASIGEKSAIGLVAIAMFLWNLLIAKIGMAWSKERDRAKRSQKLIMLLEKKKPLFVLVRQ